LGAVAGLSLKGFPITHLIIHPLRLRTPKHLEVQAMEGVHIVTPEWVFECALSWAKVKEENYTPEQWQRKAEARQKQKEAAAASVRDETIKKVQSTQSLESTSSVALEGDTIAKSSEGAESKPSSPEEDNVVKPTKEKKSVRFDVEEAKIESPTQNVVKRTKRATMTTRPIVSARNVEQPARIPDRKGIVASGGSFDFLNKLTRISSNTRGQRKESDIVKVVKKQQDQTNQKQAKAKEKVFLTLDHQCVSHLIYWLLMMRRIWMMLSLS
jgi:hypothetical protein